MTTKIMTRSDYADWAERRIAKLERAMRVIRTACRSERYHPREALLLIANRVDQELGDVTR